MRSCTFVAFALAIAFILAACARSPVETAEVSGTVTLDGQPLAEAAIQFIPEHGRMSMAMTDQSGHYQLEYSGSRSGALLGKHKVRISTWQAPDGDRHLPGVPERVPTKYNVNTELTADVVAGTNLLDFQLDAKGKIVQPH